MHFVFEILMTVLFEWFFLLPSKLVAVFRGEKFTYESFTVKDYYIAFGFWAIVVAALILKS